MWSLKALKIKDAQERQEVLACRACLATGVVLYNIHENNLTEDYVQIVGISLHDRYPQQLCCYCAALLQKCAAFRERCRNAYSLLMDICFSGKSMSIKNIQDVQKSHSEMQIPFSLSGTEIEEICNEETVTDEPTPPSEPHHDTNLHKTEIKHESNDNDFDYSDGDMDVDNETNDSETNDNETNDNEKIDIDMTIGDLIDTDDAELEVIENKWMNGEYRIENLIPDVDSSLEALRQSGVIDECDLKVFERMPKWNEQHNLTDTDIISLARMHEFRAVFPNKEEQIQEVEEMKQRRGLVCKLCGMIFKKKLRLNKHTKNLHDPTAKCICKICKARFHYMFRLRHHILQHRVTYQCEQCDFKTKNRLDMPNHQSRHKEHRFICDACGKPFLTVSAMQKHIRMWHTTSRPWCDVCGMAFVNQLGVETHVRFAHKNVEVFPCECSAEFLSETALERHRGLGCGAWSCKHCGYVLGSGYLLKLHLLLQHQAPPHMRGPLTFDCWVCLVSFHSTKGLEAHWATCGQNLHCVQCGENFTDARLLAEHATRHDAVGLTCGECGEPCKTVCLLQQHYYKTHVDKGVRGPVTRKRKPRESGLKRNYGPKYFKDHKSKVWGIADGKLVARTPEGRPLRECIQKKCMCHVCGKVYASQVSLDTHLRLHTGEDLVQCDRCAKQFVCKQALTRHIRSHDDKPIKCPKCPMMLKSGLYKHMLTHSKEKRHICQICGKGFKVSTSVKMHIKTVHMKIPLPPRVRSRSKKTVEQASRKKTEEQASRKKTEEQASRKKTEEQDSRNVAEDVEYECVVYEDYEEDSMSLLELTYKEE